MPLQTFAVAVGVSRCSLLRPNPHKPASKLTWCLLFSPPAEPLWRQRCRGTDRPEVWGHFITGIFHWGQRIYYNQLCAAWLHSFFKIKQERKKNTPLFSHLLIHLLPSPVFPLSVLLFLPGAQVVLPEVAPVCPSLIFPTPSYVIHYVCWPHRTTRTTSPLWFPTGLAPLVYTNSFCTSNPSEVTVLTRPNGPLCNTAESSSRLSGLFILSYLCSAVLLLTDLLSGLWGQAAAASAFIR